MADLSVGVQIAILVITALRIVIRYDRSVVRLLLVAVAVFGSGKRSQRARELLKLREEPEQLEE